MEKITIQLPQVKERRNLTIKELFDSKFQGYIKTLGIQDKPCTLVSLNLSKTESFDCNICHLDRLLHYLDITKQPYTPNVAFVLYTSDIVRNALEPIKDKSLFYFMFADLQHEVILHNNNPTNSLILYKSNTKATKNNIVSHYKENTYNYTPIKEMHTLNYLNNESYSLSSIKNSIHNRITKYNKLLVSNTLPKVNKISFPSHSLLGDSIWITLNVPNVYNRFAASTNYIHSLLETIEDISLKDPNFTTLPAYKKQDSILKRAKLLLHHCFTSANFNCFIKSKQVYDYAIVDRAKLVSTDTNSLTSLDINTLSRSVKERILDDGWSIEKYISNLPPLFKTKNDTARKFLNLFVYGTYLLNKACNYPEFSTNLEYTNCCTKAKYSITNSKTIYYARAKILVEFSSLDSFFKDKDCIKDLNIPFLFQGFTPKKVRATHSKSNTKTFTEHYIDNLITENLKSNP